MPYANPEARHARQRWQRRRRLWADGLEPLEPADPSSPLRCRGCGRVTARTDSTGRHAPDCRQVARLPLPVLLERLGVR